MTKTDGPGGCTQGPSSWGLLSPDSLGLEQVFKLLCFKTSSQGTGAAWSAVAGLPYLKKRQRYGQTLGEKSLVRFS
jgi:hypothetical protein